MNVSYQLLADLVSAYENSHKFGELRSELLSLVLKEGVVSRAYRLGEYNIQVTPIPFRGPQLTIERAQNLTPPQVKPDAVKEELRPGTIGSTYHGGLNAASKVPGNAEALGVASTSEREAAVAVLDILQRRFHWNASSRGRKFWVDLTNQLRSVAGWPPQTY